MTIPQDTRVEQLRSLAARIYDSVEDYAQGKVDDSNEIVRQCQTLLHRAESPEVFAERLRYQPLDLCALMIAVEGGMLQALSSRKGEETTADQLAEITSRPRVHITRVMRLLTAIGVCDEVGPQRYRANDKTYVMASRGQIGGLRVSSVPCSTILSKIEEYFSKCADGTITESHLNSPFTYTFGKPMYDVLRDTNRREDFDAFMEARKQEKKRRWHHCYPVMSELAEQGANLDTSEITIVDVGGSRGHDLDSFAESNPEFDGRLILQDLPETVKPLGAEKHVFEAMPYDFFTPQPVKDAKLYLLLAVIHNWDDESCHKILKNLADAMKAGYSRLLISGVPLPDVGAERRAAELDLQMWVLQQTKQRTETEWVEMVKAAGLEIVKIWNNGDRESLVEVRKP